MKIIQKVLVASLSLGLLDSAVFAQSSTSTTSASQSEITGSTLGGINKQYKANDEITDNKMRADDGSLSQFSAKFSLNYYGPPVGDLNNQYSPNIDGRVSNNQTAVSGTIGLQYRFSSQDTVQGGTGIKGNFPTEGFPDGFSANTPYVSYAHTTRWHGIQIRQSPEIDKETIPTWTGVGESWGLSYSVSTVYDFDKSRYAVGLDMTPSYYIYSRGYASGGHYTSTGCKGGDCKVNTAYLSIYPTFKYQITDKANFYTSVTLPWTNPRDPMENPDNNITELLPQTMRQNLGVSYSFTRDIYIYPSFYFYPLHMDWANTSLSISTVFSIL